ncbi:MAG: hypothetical protein ACQER9_03225 [Nanobdellota archaeon]
MELREKVLNLVKEKGPILPTDINSELKESSFIIGAMLSELSASKNLKITNAKVDGSPLYYVEGQETKLERLYKYLNEKNKRAYDVLKKEKVLLDEAQVPLMKEALRQIKDFAVPFRVSYNGNNYHFWKWHLSSDEEVKKIVKDILSAGNKETPPTQKPIQEEQKKEPVSEEKATEGLSKYVKEKNKETPQENTTKEKEQIDNKLPQDSFAEDIKNFFGKRNIEINTIQVIRKSKELDLEILVPSALGKIRYYCKAKSKKTNNEGDIASAFIEGQVKGLPVLYMSKGDLPKKTKNLLKTKYKTVKIIDLSRI